MKRTNVVVVISRGLRPRRDQILVVRDENTLFAAKASFKGDDVAKAAIR